MQVKKLQIENSQVQKLAADVALLKKRWKLKNNGLQMSIKIKMTLLRRLYINYMLYTKVVEDKKATCKCLKFT